MRFLNQIIAIRERDYQALLCFNPADHLESDIVGELAAVYTNITNTLNSVAKTQESTGERTNKTKCILIADVDRIIKEVSNKRATVDCASW